MRGRVGGTGPIRDSVRRAATFGTVLITAVLLLDTGGSASARTFRPAHHKIFHGVSDTTRIADFRGFKKRVGAHPAVLQDFYHWDTPLTSGALQRWRQTGTRGVLSLSTAPGGGPELISPRAIARGHGDDYIVRLNQTIAASRQVVYVRLFPEMNGYWNPYCAFTPSGAPKGRSHSTASLREAWRRIALIVHGGKRRKINRRLRRRHLPRILRADSNHDAIYKAEEVPRVLPRPKVSFMWTPQTIGSPNVAGNQPANYWPGRRFVDWVGADIYSAFATPGVWSAFTGFYRSWRHRPFVVGEYSPWDNDYRGRFTRRLFHWAERHGRARMLIYYRSVRAGTPFDISRWPRARHVLRHELNKRRFDPYAPHTRHRRR